MNKGLLICSLVTVTLCLGGPPVMAQSPGQAPASLNYECPANAHCMVSCAVDGEKIFQTGTPRTIAVTLLAPNNYLVQLVEQSGHVQFGYLTGTKVICTFEGVTKKSQ
jgi:hypothetical protein